MSMKKNILKIGLGLLLIVILFLIIKKSEAEDRPFNMIELTSNNTINNGIFPTYYDTVLSVAMDVMGLSGYSVVIGKLTDEASNQFDGRLKAHVRYFNSNFYLFTEELDRKESIEVLCHEVIHMEQYTSGDLYYIDNQVTWKGDILDLDSKEYESRPWENDAYSRQNVLIDLVEKKLYGNQ